MDDTSINNLFPEEPDDPLVTQTKEKRTDPKQTGIDQSTYRNHIIVVYSLSGGTGKTTIATSLATELQRKRERVLLIDCALPSGDVGVFLNLQATTTLYTLVEDLKPFKSIPKTLDPALIKDHLISDSYGLKILLAPREFKETENIDIDFLKNVIEYLRSMFDFIVIDTSSSLNSLNLSLLSLADHVLLMANPTLPSVKNASVVLDLFESLKYDTYKVHLVFNEVDELLEQERITIPTTRIETYIGRRAIAYIPRHDKRVIAAVNSGTPVINSYRAESPATDLMQLTNAIYVLCRGDTL